LNQTRRNTSSLLVPITDSVAGNEKIGTDNCTDEMDDLIFINNETGNE